MTTISKLYLYIGIAALVGGGTYAYVHFSAPKPEMPVVETQQEISSEKTTTITCENLPGTYTSIELGAGGNTPHGSAASMHWVLTFTASGTFSWVHSDVVESGTYTCEGSEINARTHGAAHYTGTITSNEIIWREFHYQKNS